MKKKNYEQMTKEFLILLESDKNAKLKFGDIRPFLIKIIKIIKKMIFLGFNPEDSNIESFLDSNQNHLLLSEYEKNEVIEEIKLLQRIYKIVPNADVGRVLLDLNIHSSADVVSLGKEEFFKEMEKRLVSAKDAGIVYQNSIEPFKKMNIVDLSNFLGKSIYQSTVWAIFKPNDEKLWSQIRLNVGEFMHRLFMQGVFQGETPKEAYFVKCGSETTTQYDIDQKIVNIIVGFAPIKPRECTVVLTIQQNTGNA